MTAAAGAAAAAAARQEALRLEEEQETAPMSADEGYEYKILRSNWGSFNNPATLRSVLEFEAQAGWDLFEKLDNNRLRLRRAIQCREQDAERSQDAYRTWVGPSENTAGLIVLVLIFGGVAIALAFAVAFH